MIYNVNRFKYSREHVKITSNLSTYCAKFWDNFAITKSLRNHYDIERSICDVIYIMLINLRVQEMHYS